MDRDLVLYMGLLGTPSDRMLGAAAVYVSLGQPFQLRLHDDERRDCEYAVVPPYVVHQVSSPDRLIGLVLLEPESFDADHICSGLGGSGLFDLDDLARRVRGIHGQLSCGQLPTQFLRDNLETSLFGAPLRRRVLDERIAATLDRIKADPCGQRSAQDCANDCRLSVCHFVHLFKNQVGATFRQLRAWKRARALLEYVDRGCSLTMIAMDVGYPDLTHFSHSIRQFYGLTPKSIMEGSRRLAVVKHTQSARARPL